MRETPLGQPQPSFEERAALMTTEELFLQLGVENGNLADLGVQLPISTIVYGARMYGRNYEDRRLPGGAIRGTPMNCLMALLYQEPELRMLPVHDFRELAVIVTHIAMIVDALTVKCKESVPWPDQFKRPPQRKD